MFKSQDEINFFDYTWGFKKWIIPTDIYIAACDEARLERVKPFANVPSRTPSLDEVVKDLIHLTHILMLCFPQENRDELVYELANNIINLVKAVYSRHYKQNIRAEFEEKFKECLFLSIYLSYSQKETQKYYAEKIFLQGYVSNAYPELFDSYKKLINQFISKKKHLISNDKLDMAHNEANLFLAKVNQKYRSSTRPKKQLRRAAILIILFLAAIYMSSIDLFFLPNLAGALLALSASLFLFKEWNSRYAERELSPETKENYRKKFSQYCIDYLKFSKDQIAHKKNREIIFEDFPFLRKADLNSPGTTLQLSRLGGKNPEKAWLISTFAHEKIIGQLTWNKTAASKKLEVLRGTIENEDLPVNRLSYSTSSSEENYDFPVSELNRAKSLYSNNKHKKTAATHDNSSMRTQNTYTHVLKRCYQCSAELQQRGILVLQNIDNPTKGFFNFGAYKEMIMKELQSDVTSGVFERGFIASENEFKGFKFLKNEGYEFKLFDGRRILFHKTPEYAEISDNQENLHRVPIWEPKYFFQK